MTFRGRLLAAGLLLAVAPLAFFGVRARHDVAARLRALDQRRVDGLATVIQEELARQSDAVGVRLDRLAEAMAGDNRLRVALRGRGADRAWLLDYAGRAMRLSGLGVLRIQDEDGRVLSSGHFRNEYDVVDPALPAALRRAGNAGALVAMPTASGSILALARARAVRIGARDLTLVGGVAVDQAFLDRLARGTGLDVRLIGAPGVGPGPAASARAAVGPAHANAVTTPAPGTVSTAHGVEAAPQIPGATNAGYVRTVPIAAVNAVGETRVEIRASSGPLQTVLRGLDRWLALTLAAAVAFALLLALLVSARLSRPVATLAGKAARLDLDRLDVSFATRRGDEIGTLSRALDRMTARLRASATRAREAERRATIGDMARQVNHDVRNGLIPIRNVVSHLAQLARERPDELATVFRERQQTLESSVAYLQELAANYARLSPQAERRPCDLNAIVRDVAREAAEGTRLERTPGSEPENEQDSEPPTESPTPAVALDLDPRLPAVEADPVALRRIVENLVVNALESLEDGGGRVTVSTGAAEDALVLEVTDTGRGMQPDERERIFQDFYTTKAGGTGLGLSIVRRIVGDLGGRIAVDSTAGAGSRFTVQLPAHPQRSPEANT
jgi:signal transduction histidine kinase